MPFTKASPCFYAVFLPSFTVVTNFFDLSLVALHRRRGPKARARAPVVVMKFLVYPDNPHTISSTWPTGQSNLFDLSGSNTKSPTFTSQGFSDFFLSKNNRFFTILMHWFNRSCLHLNNLGGSVASGPMVISLRLYGLP